MSFLTVLTLLTFINAYTTRIVSWILKLIPPDRSIQQINATINELKKELILISMVDEFAKHAKVQRKLNKLSEDRKNLVKENAFKQGKIKYLLILTLYVITVGALVILAWQNRHEVVVEVPGRWLWPFASLFNWFSGVPGAITVPSWAVISFIVSRTVVNNF